MIREEGGRLCVSGPVTFATVTGELEAGLAKLGSGAAEVDLSGITEADSSAVSLLLEWARTARSRNVPLRYTNIPANLRNLAELYGVLELIPQ